MAGSSRAVRVEAEVPGDSLQAFESFVAALNEQWLGWTDPHGLDVEPHAGGTIQAGVGPLPPARGRITLWQPGHRLEADWREPDWPSDVVTLIAVSFAAVGETTRIEVEHGGFERLGDSAAPARRYELRWRTVLDALER